MLRSTGVGTLVVAVVTSLVLVGCPDNGGPPETSRSCTFVPSGDTLPDTRTVEVGEEVSSGGPDTFAPYVEGGTAEVIAGGQGANMVVPAFRLAALDTDDDNSCFEVTFSIRAIDSSWDETFTRTYRFDREGEFLYGGTVQLPIRSFGGESVMVEATIIGEDFSSSFGPLMLTLN